MNLGRAMLPASVAPDVAMGQRSQAWLAALADDPGAAPRRRHLRSSATQREL